MPLLRPAKLEDFFLDQRGCGAGGSSFVAGSTASPSPPFVMGSFSRPACNFCDEVETQTEIGDES